jgi:hypothetical protein
MSAFPIGAHSAQLASVEDRPDGRVVVTFRDAEGNLHTMVL